MSTVTARRIRLALDYAKPTTYRLLDLYTNASPELWRGNDVRFEIGLLFNSSVITDISTIASLILSVFASQDPTAQVLATKTIVPPDIINCSQEDWDSKASQHALVEFTAAEMDLTPADAYWLAVAVVTTDSPSKAITLGAATFKIYEDALE